jgi:hypothetical protein
MDGSKGKKETTTMRINVGFGVALAVASLMAAGTASGQSGAAGGTGNGAAGGIGRTTTTSPHTLLTAPNNLEQQANQAANNAVGTTAVPGQVAPPPAAGNVATTPGSTYEAPGTTGTPFNPAGVPTTNTYQTNPAPGTVTPGRYAPGAAYPQGTYGATTYSSNYYAPGFQQGTYPAAANTAASPGYTGRVMPGMAGYNSVNPMGTTMAPGYYYAGTAGMPYATGATTGYSSMYVAPGYYSTQPQTYTVQQRRGLFGGLFRRRNRVVYSSGPYGTTYGTAPSGYTTTSGYYPATTPGTYYYTPSPY